jgi:transposase-like protein
LAGIWPAGVNDAVIDDVHAWQQRPLDDVYPVVFLDCMVVKIREKERSGVSSSGFEQQSAGARSNGARRNVDGAVNGGR